MSAKILLYVADAAVPAVGLISYLRHFKSRAALEEACLDMVNVGVPLYTVVILAMWGTAW